MATKSAALAGTGFARVAVNAKHADAYLGRLGLGRRTLSEEPNEAALEEDRRAAPMDLATSIYIVSQAAARAAMPSPDEAITRALRRRELQTPLRRS